MQNCAEFGRGCEFIIDEVKNYIEKHKETIVENIKFQDGGDNFSEREVIDVEDFLEWINEQ